MSGLPESYLREKQPANIIAGGAVLTSLATLCVIARVYTHAAVTRNFGAEDVFIIIANLFLFVLLVGFVGQSHYGLGYHVAALDTPHISGFFRWFYMAIWASAGAVTCTKFSIAFQYRRIFATPRFQITVKIMLVVITVFGLWTFLSSIFSCWPISYFWDRSQAGGKCLPAWNIFIANSVFNIITDIMLVLSPMPVIKNLHLPRRQRFALMGLFAIGGFVVVVSLLRLIIFVRTNGTADFTWENVTLGLWTETEISVGIICCSAPALKPLVMKIFPAFGSSKGTKGNSYGRSNGRTQRDTERHGMATVVGAGDEENFAGDQTGLALGRFGDKGMGINVVRTVEAEIESVGGDRSGSQRT